MSTPCKKCGGTDFTEAGKCKACKRATNNAYLAKLRSSPSVGDSAVKAKAKNEKPAAAESPAPAAPALQLAIEQGYGLKAWTDDAYLMIEQHDGEGKTDAICVSRTEFKRLIETFGGWSG